MHGGQRHRCHRHRAAGRIAAGHLGLGIGSQPGVAAHEPMGVADRRCRSRHPPGRGSPGGPFAPGPAGTPPTPGGETPPPRRHIGQLAIQLVGLHGIGRISGWDNQGPEKGKIAKRTHFAVRAERIVLRNKPIFARVREFSPKPASAGAGASCRPPPRGPGARKWPSPPPQWIPVSVPRLSSQRSPTSAAWPPSNCLIRSAVGRSGTRKISLATTGQSLY